MLIFFIQQQKTKVSAFGVVGLLLKIQTIKRTDLEK
jgi:hypothetical protein